MMKTGKPWVLSNTFEVYRDFEQWLTDNESGIGGILRITLVDEPGKVPSAYGSIFWNGEDGVEFEPSEFEITRAQAELILGDVSNQRVPGAHP